ncbi:MAG TPA: TonB family protein [Candidatus Cloacimonadota bacterium]|nr:TonB family protein [Candidatus Cloacimonadota bacterium]HPM01285.1 TonB family protein [Candidatus Cloacimonadota bacterium]
MDMQFIDWKDIASSYYDKCLSLTILLMLFTFIVFPNFETKVIKAKERVLETVEVLDEIQEKIEQPQEVAKPIVNIEIVEGAEADDENIEEITTIEKSILQPEVAIAPPTQEEGKTSKFVIYEEPPVFTVQVQAEYPAFAKKSKIQGTVILDVEILANGTVGAVEVKKSLLPGPGGLDEAAIASIKKSKFQPAKNAGKPVAVWVTLPIVFSLSK